MLVGCGGSQVGSQADVGDNEAEIIGGQTDSKDSAVVALFASQPGSQQGALCTATLIAPTVLLTAAHCVSPDEVGDNAEFHVFLGNNLNTRSGTWVNVRGVTNDPAFDTEHPELGHDVGIVVLQKALPFAPVAYNKAPLRTSMLGKRVRLVGYGLSNGHTQQGAGVKRQATTLLDDADGKLLAIGDRAHETCNGDSGGPAFMVIGGVETIIGVTSFGNQDCTGLGYDTRIDTYKNFIGQFAR
jgi:secreted trypsin-like serine protease